MLNRTEVNDLCYWYYKKLKNKIGLMMYAIIVIMAIKSMHLLAAVKKWAPSCE